MRRFIAKQVFVSPSARKRLRELHETTRVPQSELVRQGVDLLIARCGAGATQLTGPRLDGGDEMTVYLTHAQAAWLQDRGRQSRVPQSELVREAVELVLAARADGLEV